MSAERNLRLLEEVQANRAFLLLAYASNPELLARAEPRIRQLFAPLPELVSSAQSPLPAPHELSVDEPALR